jgi:carotenoid cleavage dioxygenase-like enzyme
MGKCKYCAGVVAGWAAVIGLLTQPVPSQLRWLQMPLVVSYEGFLDKYQFNGEVPWLSQFEGAMRPVQEGRGIKLTPSHGKIPADISGVYLRVGPQISVFPPTKRTHVFDGDAMVYSVRLHNGEATMHNSYLETPRHMTEKKLGHEWFGRIGELHGPLGLVKLMTTFPKKGLMVDVPLLESGTANTALGLTPDGKMWALNEVGLPFIFGFNSDASIKSEGFDTLQGTLKSAVSAHPKHDFHTGETFYHGKDLMKRFYAGRIKDGKLVEETDLPVKDGFQHDMFITNDYVVIIDGSARFLPENVVYKKPLWTFNEQHKLRFGIAARNQPLTEENFKWIEAPYSAEIVHTCFGWNEGKTIKLFAPYATYDADQSAGILAHQSAFAMKIISIDLTTAQVNTTDVEDGAEFSTEFCRVRDNRGLQKTRYAFSAVQSGRDGDGIEGLNFTGVLKWDMHAGKRVGQIHFPPGILGGEPIYMPRGKAEDEGHEGYLGMFWWNYANKTSSFVLFDAKSFAKEPVVQLKSPTRVPLGFHGSWLDEVDFQKATAPKK